MKAMAGQVWRNEYGTGRCYVLDNRDAKEFNNERFLTHAFGWRPLFWWHNKHSKGD